MSSWTSVALALSGDAPASTPTSAIISGIATITAAIIGTVFVLIHTNTKNETHEPTYVVNFHPPQARPPAPKHRRRWVVTVLVIVLAIGGFVTGSLYLASVTTAKSTSALGSTPATAGGTVVPPQTGAGPATTTAPLPLKDSVQKFLFAYFAAFAADRSANTLGRFYAFPRPIDFYGDKGPLALTNAEELMKAIGPKLEDHCDLGRAEVLTVVRQGDLITVKIRRAWTNTLRPNNTGYVAINYSVSDADSGEPYRIFAVYEPKQQTPCT